DATPIATYHFDFGDGSPVVDTPNSTAQHPYASAGTYTVKLTCTDTGNLTSSQVSQSITITPPATGGGPVALYAGYYATHRRHPPTRAAQPPSRGAGPSPDKLPCPHTATPPSSQVSQSTPTPPPATGGGPVAVYAGYYDTHHPHVLKPKPNPWRTSTNVVFVGAPDKSGGDDWDSSALRVENLSGSTLSNVVVTTDIGSNHYALWGTHSIPPGYSLVMAQTAFDNFDGSDRNKAGCYSCNPNLCLTSVSSVIPVIKVTVNGVTTTYNDTKQLLNTGGVDRAGCPYTGTPNDEAEKWQQVLSTAAQQPSA